MPGKRKDKDSAWAALSEVLRVHQQVCKALALAANKAIVPSVLDDAWHSLNLLKFSGRLDVAQIRIIKELVRAVIRTERASYNPGFTILSRPAPGTDAQHSSAEPPAGSSATSPSTPNKRR